MKSIHLLCAALVLTLSVGCQKAPPQQPPLGSSVTVQFRRDALGSAHTLPIPPTTDSQNGAQVSMSGELTAINSEWIVLKVRGTDYWIPRSVILLVKVPHPAPKGP